jgi:hypothetical protein
MIRNPSHIPADLHQIYEVIEWKHASAVLKHDFREQYEDLISVLRGFRLKQSYVDADGGNRSPISELIDGEFRKLGWGPKEFDTQIKVDELTFDSPTHEVDNYKSGIAIEVEWTNKDPFYDRDLNNFRLLHQLGVISVGVIITRSDDLRTAFKAIGKSWEESTTHVGKLIPKAEGGGAGGCPVLVFGIGMNTYEVDLTAEEIARGKAMREERKAKNKERTRIKLKGDL